jgi:hypothetical protein
MLAFLALIIWLLPKLWRGVSAMFRLLQSKLRPAQSPVANRESPLTRQ